MTKSLGVFYGLDGREYLCKKNIRFLGTLLMNGGAKITSHQFKWMFDVTLDKDRLRKEVINDETYFLVDRDALEKIVGSGFETYLDRKSKFKDDLSEYFDEIGKVPLLTKEEEVELAKKIESSRDELIPACFGKYGLDVFLEMYREDLEEKQTEFDVKALHETRRKYRDKVRGIDKIFTVSDDEERSKSLKQLLMRTFPVGKRCRFIDKIAEDLEETINRIDRLSKKERISRNRRRIKDFKERLGESYKDAKSRLDLIKKQKEIFFDARKKMSAANLRLVVSIAKRYRYRGVSFLDLMQTGNIGLFEAMDRFEYQRGYKFSTYATCWIKQKITRYLDNHSKTIRIPVWFRTNIKKVMWKKGMFFKEFGRDPSVEELAKKTRLSKEKVEFILNRGRTVSLDKPIGEDSDFYDFLEAEDIKKEGLDENQMKELDEILSELTPRQELIVRERYGLKGRMEKTLMLVGADEDIDLTRERVRQLEAMAIRKLQHPRRMRRLQNIID